MRGAWRQQHMKRCCRCLISAVASLWLAVVAPLLCSAHDGSHSHLLDGHFVTGARSSEWHEHVHSQAAFELQSHPHSAEQQPASHCASVGDTQWALTMTILAPGSIELPQPLLSSLTAPASGAALTYYALPPDKPPRAG